MTDREHIAGLEAKVASLAVRVDELVIVVSGFLDGHSIRVIRLEEFAQDLIKAMEPDGAIDQRFAAIEVALGEVAEGEDDVQSDADWWKQPRDEDSSEDGA
jgi:hypothetical protein